MKPLYSIRFNVALKFIKNISIDLIIQRVKEIILYKKIDAGSWKLYNKVDVIRVRNIEEKVAIKVVCIKNTFTNKNQNNISVTIVLERPQL